MRRLKIVLKSRYFIKICTSILFILIIFYTKYYPFKSKYKGNETNFIGVVDSYKIKEDKIEIILKAKEKILVTYNFNNKEFNKLSYGDKILVKGYLYVPKHSTIFNNFDYNKYLYNKKIYYIVNASSINKIKNNNNYIYEIKNLIYSRVNKLKSSKYIITLLLGESLLDNEVKNSYRKNGISHLFSISGLHVGLITSIIYLYLDRITYSKKIKYLIIDIILILYLILCKLPSLYRCVVMNILFSLNDILKLNIKKVDILLLTLIICMIINPFIIYDIGFIYSYSISFFLVVYNKKIKGNNKIKNIINIATISFIVAIPINIYNNYEINLLSIVINIILVPIVSLIILPMCIVTFIFPFFDGMLYFILNILENISLYISNINIFNISLPKPNIFLIILYYLLIIAVLKNKKLIYLVITFLIIHKSLIYLNNELNVVVFDVGQADSIFMKSPNNKGNILIDTGNYQIGNIILYFKSIDIKSLRYLIITHGDTDHMGEAINLVENFKVENVIFNCGEYNDLEKELIKVLDQKKIKHYSCIKELNIDKYKLEFLNTKEYDNENDNSNVIYFNYEGYKFLFLGDAGIEKEKDILDKYNLKDIDFLKVGHHGSNTSSSEYFINSINPKYSLISVGKNNRYGHPKDEVLDILKNSKIYRTDLDGSIEIKLNKNGYKIRTCPP